MPTPAGPRHLTLHTPSCLADAPKGVEILLSPSERNIRPGDLVTLTCQVNSSYPKVSSVQWVKDGTHLKAQGRVLQLPKVAWDDAGVYTCEAENGVGASISRPVSLHVFSESWVSLGLDQRAGKGSRPLGLRGDRLRGLLEHGCESQPCLRQMASLPVRVGCQEAPGEQDEEMQGQSRRLCYRRGVKQSVQRFMLSGYNRSPLRGWAWKVAGYLQCALCCSHSG